MKNLVLFVMYSIFFSAFFFVNLSAYGAFTNNRPDCAVQANGGFTGELGEKCGIRAANNVIINCKAGLVCSSNEFNPCTTRVCLVPVGGDCATNKSFECEGGSICNPTTTDCDISPDDDTASSSDLRDTIRRILNVILGFLGIITVVMVIYGGFVWLTAAGNEDAVGKGRHTLLWAALGAILIGIAWTVSSYILSVAEKVG